MQFGRKGLTGSAHGGQAVTRHGFQQQLAGHGHALEHVLAGLVLAAVLQGQIEVVQRGQQVAHDLFRRIADLFLVLALQALLEVIHLRGRAQACVIGIALFGAVGAHMFVAQAFQIFRQGLHGVPGIPGLGTGTGLFLRFRVLRVLHMHIIVLVVTIHGSSQKCTGVVPASIE